MNEDRLKVRIGRKREKAISFGFVRSIVKPNGKFWKRYFNKKVRNGADHKRLNWENYK